MVIGSTATIGFDDNPTVSIGVKITRLSVVNYSLQDALIFTISKASSINKERKSTMNNKEKRTGSFDDLPMSLNADDISSVLNISIGNAYNLLHREDFPTIHIGKRMVVPRDRFFAWIEKQYADRGLVI